MTLDRQSIQQQDEIAELQEKLATQESLATLGLAWIALQHRLKNTINILLPGILRLKKHVGQDNQETIEIIKSLERNINHLATILNRLDVLIPRETELESQDVNTLLYEAIQELVSVLVGDITTKDITVNYQLSDEVPLIKTNAGLLKEVFRNLAENSFKALGNAGGNLEIVTRYLSETGQVKIEIKDSGCGIPPGIRDKLFLHPIKGSPTSGAGLGLWLSKLLLGKLGGSIQVAHTQVGIGTTMAIILPVVH